MQFLSLSHHPNHGFIYTSEPGSSSNLSHAAVGSQHKPQLQSAAAMATGAAALAPREVSHASLHSAYSTDHMVMSCMPLPSHATLFQHFVYACQPLWCHRHTVSVPSGPVYDVGDFRVRIGDVRQTQPVARLRGTIVEIEWRGPSVLSSISTAGRRLLLESASTPSQKRSEDGANYSRIVEETDLAALELEDSDVDAELVAAADLIRDFWARLGIDGAKEAILVPGVGKEIKARLRRCKMQSHTDTALTLRQERKDGWQLDQDPDPDTGVDTARQYMEILRFNR